MSCVSLGGGGGELYALPLYWVGRDSSAVVVMAGDSLDSLVPGFGSEGGREVTSGVSNSD